MHFLFSETNKHSFLSKSSPHRPRSFLPVQLKGSPFLSCTFLGGPFFFLVLNYQGRTGVSPFSPSRWVIRWRGWTSCSSLKKLTRESDNALMVILSSQPSISAGQSSPNGFIKTGDCPSIPSLRAIDCLVASFAQSVAPVPAHAKKMGRLRWFSWGGRMVKVIAHSDRLWFIFTPPV